MAAKHRRDAARSIRRRHDFSESPPPGSVLEGDVDDERRRAAAAAHANTNPYLDDRAARQVLGRSEGLTHP